MAVYRKKWKEKSGKTSEVFVNFVTKV